MYLQYHGDRTTEHFRLFYQAVLRFCGTKLSKFKMSYCGSYLRLETFVQLSTFLEWTFQKRHKKWEDFTYE